MPAGEINFFSPIQGVFVGKVFKGSDLLNISEKRFSHPSGILQRTVSFRRRNRRKVDYATDERLLFGNQREKVQLSYISPTLPRHSDEE